MNLRCLIIVLFRERRRKKFRYDETISYVVTEKEGRYFLLELVDDMTLDEVQMAGEITDHVLVFEISEEFYLELDALITAKP